MIVSIIIITITLVTFIYASYCDLKSRIVPFDTWYPMILVCAIPTLAAIIDVRIDILPMVVVITSFYLIGRVGAMGGADVWGMIFLLLFCIVPLGLPVIEFVKIIIGASVIGIIITLFKIYKTKEWNTKIPFIPAITMALSGYFFLALLGSPLV